MEGSAAGWGQSDEEDSRLDFIVVGRTDLLVVVKVRFEHLGASGCLGDDLESSQVDVRLRFPSLVDERAQIEQLGRVWLVNEVRLWHRVVGVEEVVGYLAWETGGESQQVEAGGGGAEDEPEGGGEAYERVAVVWGAESGRRCGMVRDGGGVCRRKRGAGTESNIRIAQASQSRAISHSEITNLTEFVYESSKV